MKPDWDRIAALQEALRKAMSIINDDKALLRQALEASQAMVDRWDSPAYKDLPHTGVYVLELRKLCVRLRQRLGEEQQKKLAREQKNAKAC